MAPIRKGDGTPLEIPGVSEVRSGDGRVFFEGVAIPDSEADHQWNFDQGSGTLIEDVIGNEDADFTGGTWESNVGAGDYAFVLDGTDDKADMSDDMLTGFKTDVEGTVFSWVRNDDRDDRMYIIGTQNVTGSGTNFALGFHDNNYSFNLTLDGSRGWVEQGDPESNVGDWVALAATIDNSEVTLYVAEPSGYSLTELGTDDSPSSTSDDWDNPVAFGYDPNGDNEYYEGALDLTFAEERTWSESELQGFVDDTKHFYE